MADLVLGPVLRHVGTDDATIWVETDSPCEVRILGHAEPTFGVEGRHYAIVPITGLEPGTETAYEVSLDGERRWPPPSYEFPAPAIRTLEPGRRLRISFGSCRVALPHEPPYTLPKDEHPEGLEHDALYALAQRVLAGREERPDLLLMVGDQVYVDEGSPRVHEWIRSRRDGDEGPGDEINYFDEFCALYDESWSDPVIRWLFSTTSTAMVLDDHDMSDDWNISYSWLEEMREHEWWLERVQSGLMSYWIYQHIGNLSPQHLEQNPQFQAVRREADAGPLLREFAREVDLHREGTRWSFVRELDGARLIVVDDRSGRLLEPERRAILDDEEWRWLEEQVRRECEHLLIATTDPYLLAPALHHLEAWNERVCDGAWGRRAARLGERMRRAADFDHWAAFSESFGRLAGLLRDVGSGRFGYVPRSIGVLSGDVHHAYLVGVDFPDGAGVESLVYQAVCSPFRNALASHERRSMKVGWSRPALTVARGLSRAAGAAQPPFGWRLIEGPFFDNQVATLELDGRASRLRLEKIARDPEGTEARLETSFERQLT